MGAHEEEHKKEQRSMRSMRSNWVMMRMHAEVTLSLELARGACTMNEEHKENENKENDQEVHEEHEKEQ